MRPLKMLKMMSWVIGPFAAQRGAIESDTSPERRIGSLMTMTTSGWPAELAAGLLDRDGGVGALDDLGYVEEVVFHFALGLGSADEEIADQLMVAAAEERLVRHQPDFGRQLHV